MKKTNFILTLVITAMALSCVQCYNPVKFLKLSERNIKIAIKKYNRLLILFHSKWCDQSKKTFEVLAEMVKSPLSEEIRKNRVVIAHFMSKDQKEVLTELGVSQYPELRFWNDGAQITYDGKDYSQDEIWKFLSTNMQKDAIYLEGFKKLEITEKPKIVSILTPLGRN